jgi:hypothetical protein
VTGPNTHKEYTAADIERYHNGTMPPEEAHALERAALEDPFLADAIDGYVHTATPAADAASLRQQLQNRSGKVIALTKKKRPAWLRVAATVVLLAGFGWMVYKLYGNRLSYLSNNGQQDIAVQTEATPQAAEQSMQQPAADSITADAEETIATARVQNKSVEKPVAKAKATATSEAPKMADQEFARNNSVKTDTLAFSGAEAPALVSVEGYAMAKRAADHTFKARVTDTTGNPLPFATITVAGTNKSTQADAIGTFSITAPDTNLTVNVSAAGFNAQQVLLNQGDSNATIALARGENQLQEMVVTGLGKRAANNKRLSTSAEGNKNVHLEAVAPIGGWKRFNAYVAENGKLPEEIADTLTNREAVLWFDVDKQGNAINIIIEKPLCPSCDSTAVRIIQEGSKWKKTGKAARAKAYIRF